MLDRGVWGNALLTLLTHPKSCSLRHFVFGRSPRKGAFDAWAALPNVENSVEN